MERVVWKQEEVQFLKENKGLLNNEDLCKGLYRRFGKSVTVKQIRNKLYMLNSQNGGDHNSSICWDCYRASGEGRGCPWVDSSSSKPVNGWETIERPLKQPETNKRLNSKGEIKNNLIVIKCPLFLGEVVKTKLCQEN